MRPLQLTLNFFGPYRHQQIDFTKFDQSAMFLISGATGAGKSTIFDGLVFALYDKASGSQREPREFRSDFATYTDETSVMLTFTHRGHYYRLIRKPKQTLAKKRGQGTTDQAPQIELTIYADETPTQELKQFTKIDQANKYLADLLQLNAAQFRQIVLLPQGEFRQFLNGDSNEKEAVLRNLFQTQHYEQWIKQLQLNFKKLKDENGQRQQQITTLLNQIDWLAAFLPKEHASVAEQLQLLQQQLKQLQQTEQVQQGKVSELKAAIAKQQAELTKRQQVKALFAQQTNSQHKLTELKLQEPAIDQLRVQVQQLQWAQTQKNTYQVLQQTQISWTKAQRQLQTTTTMLQDIEQAQQTLKKSLTELQTHETEQAQFQRQLIEYGALVPKYQQLTALQSKQQQLTEVVLEQQQQHEEIKKQLVTFQQTIQTLKDAQQQLPDFYQIQRQLDQHQNQLTQQIEQAQKLTELQHQLEELSNQKKHQQEKLIQANQAMETAQQSYRELKSDYAAQQIAVLQRDLLPGQPCPVCGSLEHPHIATTINTTALITDEMLEQADQTRQQTAQQFNTIKADIALKQKELVQVQERYQADWQTLIDHETMQKLTLTTVLERLAHQQSELQQDQLSLKAQQDKASQQRQEMQTQETQQQELIQQEQQLREQVNEQERSLAVIKTQIEDIQQQLPQQFHSVVELTEFLNDLKQQVTSFKAKQTELQQKLQQYQQQQTANETDQRHYQQQVEESQTQIAQLKTKLTQHFNQKWPGESFTDQCTQFENLLAELPTQAELTQKIDNYEQQIISQQAVLQQLNEQLKDYSEVPNVETAELTLQQLQQQQNQLQEELGQLKSQINQQTKIYQQIEQLTKRIVDLTTLQELSELTRGSGVQKLGLERYVLQTYLVQVLEVANQRLAKLTKGRYRLALAQELSNAKKNSGLELNVFDDYVGDYRSVRTLSGGESFIAALALALALGEVVQQQTGAIEINALFIDEGFGSLDEEALNTAIEALMSLESRQRMIGIISHVRELQAQIPEQLKVISHGNGESSIEYQLSDK